MDSNIRVLVVDDSVVFREILREGLNKKEGIEVIATARDAFEARDMLLEYRPNVMVCDIEMPKMNGIKFIKKVLPQYPIPTIVISSLDSGAFDAMEAGAVDFVAKCSINKRLDQKSFIDEVANKIRIAKKSRVKINKKVNSNKENNVNSLVKANKNIVSTHIEVIALGASTGGTEAIASVLTRLPNNVPGIVVVQHIPPMFSTMFAQRVNKCTGFDVKEAQTGDEIKSGTVLIAPGDKHFRVVRKGGKLVASVEEGEKVSGHCPSVDVLFDSVAKEVGKNALGVIMTGMGADGAKGLLAMRNNGARTIGQDKESCIVYGMPKEAYNMGGVQKQASLDNIPKTILEMLI